jgi:hypothetical protein
MWPFKKKPPLEPEGSADSRNVDTGFGNFAPLFEGTVGYLQLLNLDEPEARQAISLIMKCCASAANPYLDICRLLRQVNWRPHLVGGVAIATLAHDSKANQALWAAIDAGSWVTPQLAAVAFLRDPMFADHARERLRSGCRVDTSQSAGLSALERHISSGPGGSVERSAKTAASLVRLVGLLPQQPDWLAEETSSPDVTNLVKRDIHSSGLIAERWLEMLRQKLVHLGLATPDESSKQN